MERMVWVRIGTTEKPRERTEFESVVSGNELIILGGINNIQYIRMDMCIINLDIYNVRKQRKDYDINEKIENRKTIVDTRLETKKSLFNAS